MEGLPWVVALRVDCFKLVCRPLWPGPLFSTGLLDPVNASLLVEWTLADGVRWGLSAPRIHSHGRDRMQAL